ncbi:hypothetical protein [Xenorhabdus mauleonii]|nr:hypothetical protein [Xenorhabdus mauleonii]
MKNNELNNIDLHSLKLNIEKPFLTVPLKPNQDNKLFTKVTTNVKDKNGISIPNITVFISSESNSAIKDVRIYDKDNENEIPLQLENGAEGFFVKTGNDGNIIFFIHPIKTLPVVLHLYAQVLNYTNQVPANDTLYIVDSTLENMAVKYERPNILGFFGGDLSSNGDKKFLVEIEKYENASTGDYILFFVNDHYTRVSLQVRTESLGSYSISVPYEIFDKNVQSHFYYVIVRPSGDITESKSVHMDLVYKGRPNRPWKDVTRTYDMCKVYDSSGNNLIEKYHVINDDTISTSNPENAGLFVKITGTNDPTDTSKVPFGTEIILNLYITSSTRSFIQPFTHRMPTNPDDAGGKTATLTIPIPHNLLNNNLGYTNGNEGLIFFDYQIGSDFDPDVAYGNCWQGNIDTYP